MSDSTLADVRPVSAGPGPRWPRRIGLAVLLVVVVLGAVGVFGVHSRTISTEHDGYTLTVTYPQTARAGLDVPFRIDVRHPAGFDSAITLAITADYFRMFETQGFFPDADSSTSDGQNVRFTFAQPTGSRFVLDYDAYIQPSAQLGKSATIRLFVKGKVVASASLHTWLAP